MVLYPVAIEQGDADQAVGVCVPDIAGCFSACDDIDDALENVKQAIAGQLQLLAEDGLEIPTASAIAQHLKNPDYAGMIWAVVEVDVSRYLSKAEKINVTLPQRLIHQIDSRVAKDSRFKSRSAFLAAGAEVLLQRVG